MWCSVSFDPTLSVPLFKFLSNYWCRRVAGGSVEREPDAEEAKQFFNDCIANVCFDQSFKSEG